MKFIILLFLHWILFAEANGAMKPVVEIQTKHGTLFHPSDGQNAHPGVLVLHGSEGGGAGYSIAEAKRLAGHGYAALAVCYFWCNQEGENQDNDFIDIPIDSTYEALVWLKKSKYTKGYKTALYGLSKGAELTLLIATLAAEEQIEGPDVIAAHAVTDVPEVGFSWKWFQQECWIADQQQVGGYTWNPQCGIQPPSKEEGFKNEKGCYITPNEPREKYTYHSWTWRGSNDTVPTHEPIQIEKFQGPIFFTHGIDDELWCVSKARNLENRLIASGRTPEVHLFANEKHIFTSDAEVERWQLLIEFLDRNLKAK